VRRRQRIRTDRRKSNEKVRTIAKSLKSLSLEPTKENKFYANQIEYLLGTAEEIGPLIGEEEQLRKIITYLPKDSPDYLRRSLHLIGLQLEIFYQRYERDRNLKNKIYGK